MDLIMMGIQGFYQLLFFVHLGALDLPFSSLSGEELTWAYFGHYSHGFVYLIGSIQIFGSLLLLFGRTRLAGVFTLFPVMFAIVSLNYFFDIKIYIVKKSPAGIFRAYSPVADLAFWLARLKPMADRQI